MSKKVLIAGGSGLIGQRLQKHLKDNGYIIHILSRSKHDDTKQVKYFEWDVVNHSIDLDAVNVDHIINLTGAGIADERWTDKRKKIIIDSRVNSLNLLKKALVDSNHFPNSIASASAVGYYGDRGNTILTEESTAGNDFLSECCTQWENAAMELNNYTDQLAIIRIGIVLTMKGGALPKILMTKGLRVLNYFGNGQQYYSYIHIDDLCNIFIQTIKDKKYKGIINGVAPVAYPNKQFIKRISHALNGPFMVIPAPEFALNLALGEMSAVVLNSNRVVPEKLEELGFEYQYNDLSDAVPHIIENDI